MGQFYKEIIVLLAQGGIGAFGTLSDLATAKLHRKAQKYIEPKSCCVCVVLNPTFTGHGILTFTGKIVFLCI